MIVRPFFQILIMKKNLNNDKFKKYKYSFIIFEK